MKLKALLKKECKAYQNITISLFLLVLTGEIYAIIKASPESTAVLIAFLPYLLILVALPFLLIHSFTSEWNSNTHYLLFSLPVHRWQWGFAKFLYLFVFMFLLEALSTIGVEFSILKTFKDWPDLKISALWTGLFVRFSSFLFFLAALSFSMETFKFSLRKFRGLAGILYFILSVILTKKLFALLKGILPKLVYSYTFFVQGGKGVIKIQVNYVEDILFFIFGLLFLALGLFFLEKFVEI